MCKIFNNEHVCLKVTKAGIALPDFECPRRHNMDRSKTDFLGDPQQLHSDRNGQGIHLPALNMVEKLAPANLLEDEVEPVRLLKVLDQLNDVLMSLNSRKK
jgi:hypothetical protein